MCEIHATKNKLLERKLTTYETTLSISARLQQLSCNIMQMLGSVSFKLSLLLRVWDVYVCWKRSDIHGNWMFMFSLNYIKLKTWPRNFLIYLITFKTFWWYVLSLFKNKNNCDYFYMVIIINIITFLSVVKVCAY